MEEKGNDLSHPPSLHENNYLMATDLRPIWNKVGDVLLNNKCPFELVWII